MPTLAPHRDELWPRRGRVPSHLGPAQRSAWETPPAPRDTASEEAYVGNSPQQTFREPSGAWCQSSQASLMPGPVRPVANGSAYTAKAAPAFSSFLLNTVFQTLQKACTQTSSFQIPNLEHERSARAPRLHEEGWQKSRTSSYEVAASRDCMG